MLLKRAKTRRRRLFFSTLFFYSNWKQFQVVKIAKFEFKVTVHYDLWAKCTQLWPLKCRALNIIKEMYNKGSWVIAYLITLNKLDGYGSLHHTQNLYICMYNLALILTRGGWHLTAHNWQNWKRVFLTCHEIDKDEAVGLKSCKYTWKITIYVNIWNLGQFREFWYFVNNCLIEIRIKKFFCTCVTHIIVIICSTAHFVST